jgi:hypothetical protein
MGSCHMCVSTINNDKVKIAALVAAQKTNTPASPPEPEPERAALAPVAQKPKKRKPNTNTERAIFIFHLRLRVGNEIYRTLRLTFCCNTEMPKIRRSHICSVCKMKAHINREKCESVDHMLLSLFKYTLVY